MDAEGGSDRGLRLPADEFYAQARLRSGTPPAAAGEPALPFMDLTSGYVQRALDKLPKQGAKAPWRVYQNYAKDCGLLRFGRIDDGVLRFSPPAAAAAEGFAPVE